MSKFNKYILIPFLVVVMLILSAFGGISAIFDIANKISTPIANLKNDKYVPYNYNSYYDDVFDSLSKDVKKLGGYVEYPASKNNFYYPISDSFQNKEPVIKTITVMTTATGSNSLGNYVKSEPIKNALVRIDGVPRWTNSKGQIKAPIYRDYVELYVEKNGYNPYIEIIKGNSEEQIVYLKKPNDDIEIYSAMLFYAGEYFNVLTQPCPVNNYMIPTHYSEITISANIIADEYHILVNGKSQYVSLEPTFYGVMFDDLCPDDVISVQLIYQDIESKVINTQISIEELDIEPDPTPTPPPNPDDDNDNDVNIDTGDLDLGVFNGLNFKFDKLAELLGKNKLSKLLDKIKVDYDLREGTLTVRIGFEIKPKKIKEKEDKIQEISDKITNDYYQMMDVNKEIMDESSKLRKNKEELKKAQEQHDAAGYDEEIKRLKRQRQQSLDRMHNLNKKNKSKAAYMKQQQSEMLDTIKEVSAEKKKSDDKIRDYMNRVDRGEWNLDDLNNKLNMLEHFTRKDMAQFNKLGKSFVLGLDIFGIFTYNFKRNVAEELSISITGKIGFDWKGMFMAYVVPVYYGVNIELNVGADLNFIKDYDDENKSQQKQFDFIPLQKFWENIKFKVGVDAKGELGIGISDILSVGGFLQFTYAGEVYPGQFNDEGKSYFCDGSKWGHKVVIGIGIKAQALLWEWEHTLKDWELYNQESTKPKYEEINSNNTENNLTLMNINNAKIMSRQNYIFSDTDLINNNSTFYNSYKESKPQICNIDGKIILTWIEDDMSRDDFNRTVLKYAIMENGKWSQPKAVFDNGTADFYHEMYFDGENLHIVWQKLANKMNRNDLIATSRASEIYYSQFNNQTCMFEAVTRLTNDATGDFAPKFALKEKTSDSLTIFWRKNSNDDILGISGENSLYYTTLENSNWSQPKKYYKSSKYFSFASAAYINGEFVVAITEHDDIFSEALRRIRILKNNNQIVIAEGEQLNNTNFNIVSGKSVLSYYDGEQLVVSRDLETLECFRNLDSAKIGEDFKILNDNVIVYKKMKGNNKSQIYCATYNSTTESWNYDIKITDEILSIIKWSAQLDNLGKVIISYNATDDEDNCITRVVSREFNSDFEIIDVFVVDKPMLNTDMMFTIKIKNTGDYNLDDIIVTAFGESKRVNEVIGVDEIGYINIEFNVNRIADNEVFMVSAAGKTYEYIVSTKYTDLSIDGTIVIENGEQKFKININNKSDIKTNCALNIYINGVLYKKDIIFIDDSDNIELEYVLNNLNVGDGICFEIAPDIADIHYFDNTKMFISRINTNEKQIFENQYKQLLANAKNLLL